MPFWGSGPDNRPMGQVHMGSPSAPSNGLQGGTSGHLKPTVNLVLTVLAAGGPPQYTVTHLLVVDVSYALIWDYAH